MLILLGILALAVPILSGYVSTYFYDRDCPLGWRLGTGAVVGIAVFTLIVFCSSCVIGLNAISMLIGLAICTLPFLLLRSQLTRNSISQDWRSAIDYLLSCFSSAPNHDSIWVPICWTTASLFLAYFFSLALYFKPDGLYTGDVSNYGDLPFHLGMIYSFARGNNFPPQHPELAGVRLSYHFLYDLYTAILLKFGFGIRRAMVIQNAVFGVSFLTVLNRFAYTLTKDRAAAYLTPAIVLLCGGLGFEILAQNARETDQGILQLILHPIQTYTIMVPQQPHLQWGNILTTQLMTQRQFLIGLPLLMIASILIHQAIESSDAIDPLDRRNKLMVAGLVIGIMPLAHIFCYLSTIAIAGAAFLWSIIRRDSLRDISIMLLIALVLSVPQVFWVFHASNPPDIGSPHYKPVIQPGWMADKDNLIVFWLRNCGPFIPLLICAVALPEIRNMLPKTTLVFTAVFTLFFIMANVFQLSPWIWDNSKMFVVWFVGSSPLVALALTTSSKLGSKPLGPITAVGLAGVLMLSGVIDIIRVTELSNAQRVFSSDDITMGDCIARVVPAGQTVLTAPSCFTGALLSGHRLVEGFPGHLWTQGYKFDKRDADVRSMYAGAPNAGALLRFYGVRYVELGPLERATVPVNQQFFANFQVAATSGQETLYDTQTRAGQ